jgi:hypothetical protein
MRAATNAILAVVATAASLASCKKDAPVEQNITIDNGIDPNAEIETVPADEGGGEANNSETANAN